MGIRCVTPPAVAEVAGGADAPWTAVYVPAPPATDAPDLVDPLYAPL
ncbi:hypothetical protein ACFQPA_03405 [Halomarina halobia]|uniref:Uncharacterized protein n=1 Tax=Halomarina halobia TaxID=3033386 RepID=A0ABD6A4J3_9EURY|nr:hypothetical protein [Halomarina sp. PSR21]